MRLDRPTDVNGLPGKPTLRRAFIVGPKRNVDPTAINARLKNPAGLTPIQAGIRVIDLF